MLVEIASESVFHSRIVSLENTLLFSALLLYLGLGKLFLLFWKSDGILSFS